MNQTQTEVAGTLQPDGTLLLDEKPNLPAGRVRVTLQLLPVLPADDPFWQRMQARWAELEAKGVVPRSVEEVETERKLLRDESEEEQLEIERLQRECWDARKPQGHME